MGEQPDLKGIPAVRVKRAEIDQLFAHLCIPIFMAAFAPLVANKLLLPPNLVFILLRYMTKFCRPLLCPVVLILS